MQPTDEWYALIASDGIWEFLEPEEVCTLTAKKLRLKGSVLSLASQRAQNSQSASGGGTVGVQFYFILAVLLTLLHAAKSKGFFFAEPLNSLERKEKRTKKKQGKSEKEKARKSDKGRIGGAGQYYFKMLSGS